MSEEEKQAIELLKEDIDYRESDLAEYNETKYSNAERILIDLVSRQQKEIEELKDTLKCIQNSWYKDTKVIETQQKEIEELKVCLQAEKKYAEGLNNDIKSLLNIKPNNNFISKDKIREKMREIMAYTFTTSEERHYQNYAYDRLKELLEE